MPPPRKPLSAEHRAKISAALQGKPSNFRGKRHSASAKAKIGAARTARAGKPRRPWTAEERQRIADGVRGYKHSDQAKKNMRDAHARRKSVATERAQHVTPSCSQPVAPSQP